MGTEDQSSAADPLIGTVLADRYRLDELLGEGGMGKVYAAEHVLMKKRLAVKVLHRELCEMPDVVARFEREAMATGNIDHPNITAATDCGKLADGSLFLVLELVDGKNLRDEIAEGPMPVSRALRIARQIASALVAAHELGIVHRDLKPENVMLISRRGEDDVVKVLDFGIAKLPPGPKGTAPLTRAGTVFGTPEYMSPEQALGQSVDARADVYALGVITYEMLSGVRPFGGASEGILGQQLAKPIPPFAERAAGIPVPHQVEQVVHKLLAREVASRYQSAEEAAEALEALLEPAPGEPRMFTLPDGSATAVLGSADRLYAQPPEPLVASPPPLAPPMGPGGTLALLDDNRAQELAARVAEVRAAQLQTSPLPATASAPGAARPGLLSGIERGLTAACDFIDDGRARLPAGMRRALRDVPAAVILGAVTLLVWVPILASLVWLVHSRKQPDAAAAFARSDAAPSSSAPAADPLLAQIDLAKKQGRAALEKLAETHPKHPRVWLALAGSESAASAHSDAVAALAKALALDPKLAADPEASLVLAAAAHKRESAGAALALLEGPMGAAGAALVYDLSFDREAPAPVRGRAQRWVVLSPDFLKVAAPPVEVAAKLRYGKSCSDRHSLLARAGEVGDARALAYLEIMKYRGGCGRRGHDDCFSCLRKDDALQQAITAIKQRQGR